MKVVSIVNVYVATNLPVTFLSYWDEFGDFGSNEKLPIIWNVALILILLTLIFPFVCAANFN